MGSPQPNTPEYYARMRVLEAESWWNAGMRDIAARLLMLASLDGSCIALDVGCGSGQTLGWLNAMHTGWTTHGLDIANDGLTAARDAGLSVIRASAMDVPVATATVDFVTTLDVLHHLPLDGGDVAALHEIRRVLKPGGYLLVRTNAQSFPYKRDDVVLQYRKYEPSDLRRKLRSAGFDIIRMSRVNALLGLAEIPRELKAARHGDHGILAPQPSAPGRVDALKRAWLNVEGKVVASGVPLPLGRSIVALCRVPSTA